MTPGSDLRPSTAGPVTSYRCLRGRRCKDAEPDERGNLVGRAIEIPEGLCRRCARLAGQAIAALPRDYAELELIMALHGRPGEHVSGTRAAPLPLRAEVVALQTEIDATVSAWAPSIAARLRITWDSVAIQRLRGGPRVARAAHLLAGDYEALLRQGPTTVNTWVPGVGPMITIHTGLEAALRLVRLHERAQLVTSGGTGDARLPVPCHLCEAPALVRPNGADHVECRGCGASWPEADYRRLCLILADDYQDRPPR